MIWIMEYNFHMQPDDDANDDNSSIVIVIVIIIIINRSCTENVYPMMN